MPIKIVEKGNNKVRRTIRGAERLPSGNAERFGFSAPQRPACNRQGYFIILHFHYNTWYGKYAAPGNYGLSADDAAKSAGTGI